MRSVTTATRRLIKVSEVPDFMSVGELCLKLGVSRVTLWRMMRDHDFPKPTQFAGPKSPRHWRVDEVEAWLLKRATNKPEQGR